MSTVMGAIGNATGMKPDDSVIAGAALSAAKMKAGAYLTCLLETTTPELRQILSTHLQDAITEHQRWSELCIKRGWYKAEAPAEELVAQAVKGATPVLQQ